MTSNVNDILAALPDVRGALVVLSGGLDSTTSLRLAVARYGAANVSAISFAYGQKQSIELERAKESTKILGVRHQVVSLDFMAEINKGFSANVDADMAMPTIQDVIGDPAPVTYVANRNMIMFSIAAAVAEVRGHQIIICGLQANDNYNYHDTTPQWVAAMNAVLNENRKHKIEIIAPFVSMNKTDEIKAVLELDGDVSLFAHTLTCYNPTDGLSCGVCPSCAERLHAFKTVGVEDPIPYLKA